MTKKKKSKKQKKPAGHSKTITKLSRPSFFDKNPNFLPMILLLVLLLIFFNQMMFSGKTMLSPDKLTSISYVPFVEKAFDNGDYPQWNPYVFSGMPSFGSLTNAPYVDIVNSIIFGCIWLLKLIFPLPSFSIIFINYFLFGLSTYIFLQKKTGVRAIALFAALAIVFQPPVIAFYAFGHNTKLLAVIFIPIVFLALEEFLDNRKLLYFAILALAVGLQLLRKHTQISYYTFMMIGLFVIYWIIESIRQKRPVPDILKSLGFLTGALAVGVMMSAWMYLSVQEYAQYSIRGGGTGLDYNYASSWSFSPLEVLTFFVPSFLGFGGQTYWGNMPFTSYPMYMGIIPLFFAGLAIVIRRDRTVWFLALMAFLSLVISFGKEFSLIYKLLFNYLPYFNKFRVPTMILILVQFSVVVLASLALHTLWQLKDKKIAADLMKKIKMYLISFCGISGLIFLYLLVAKSSIFSRMASTGKVVQQQLQEQSYQMAMKDSVVMIVFIAIIVVLLLSYLNRKIKVNSFIYWTIVFTVINLWIVDFKLIADPKPETDKASYFRQDDVVRFLKNDTSLYRILPVLDNRPETWYGYHHIQSAYGYHPAKFKHYQDFLDETTLFPDTRGFLLKYLKPVMQDGREMMALRSPDEIDQTLWRLQENFLRMLNVKYIVTPYNFADSSYQLVLNGNKKVYQHLKPLPRTFFVDEVKRVNTKEDIFTHLKSPDFDPARLALIYEQPAMEILSGENNTAQITDWGYHKIELQVSAKSPGFLVLSEIFYPAGWTAKLGDQPLIIYQTNHILRGVFVPEGDFTITFEYKSQKFIIGRFITRLVILGCIILLLFDYRRKIKLLLYGFYSRFIKRKN